MNVYAEIVNHTIINTVICDAAFAQQFGLVPMPEGAGIGWTTADGGNTWQPPAIPVTEQNQATLQQRAQHALTANETYLALASPTSAQAIAQVGVLTKECSALIRLMLGLLDSTSGT